MPPTLTDASAAAAAATCTAFDTVPTAIATGRVDVNAVAAPGGGKGRTDAVPPRTSPSPMPSGASFAFSAVNAASFFAAAPAAVSSCVTIVAITRASSGARVTVALPVTVTVRSPVLVVAKLAPPLSKSTV